MSLKIFNDIIALLANALRFYALKYFVGIFVQKEESRWKHVSILYIIGWAWTSAISLLFSSPAMNILSNITSLFLIFFPYRIKKTKKCLAVFVIYVINALVDSIVILSLTKYTMGQPVNQVCECITSFAYYPEDNRTRKRNYITGIKYGCTFNGSCCQYCIYILSDYCCA